MNHGFWYLSRAAGFTAYFLLFISVVLGIATSTRAGRRFVSQNATFDVHRFLSILALGFTVFHVYILVGDGYFNYTLTQLTLPFLSPYRLWPIAVGSFSLYVLVIIVASFYARRHIGYRAWRSVHYLTFFLYAGATLHGITAGSDTGQAWARAAYLITGSVVLALLAYRLLYRVPESRAWQSARMAAGSFAVVAAVVLLFGTGLLSSHSAGGTGSPAGTGEPRLFLPSFDSSMNGTYVQSGDRTSSDLIMRATTHGDLDVQLNIELVSSRAIPTPDVEEGEADADALSDDEAAEARPRSRVTRNTVQLVDPQSQAVVCSGRLTAFDDDSARMSCTGAGPYAGVHIDLQTQFDASRDGTFSGTLSGQMSRDG